MTTTPEHMRELDEEGGGGFDPRWYQEDACALCQRPIYRYFMDVIVEWRHAQTHARSCAPKALATPTREWSVPT